MRILHRPHRRVGLFFLVATALITLACHAGSDRKIPRSVPITLLESIEGSLMAGAAEAKITPQQTVYLAGFDRGRESEGAHDDLFVRCLLLRKGDLGLLLLSYDLIGLQAGDALWLRESILDLPTEQILLTSTHNHHGPDTIGLWGEGFQSGVDQEYMRFLRERTLEVAQAAQEALQPVSLHGVEAVIPVEGIARNSNEPGLLDRRLRILQFRGKTGIVATLVNFGLHAEVIAKQNRMISADFPGYLTQSLDEMTGGVTFFINGALGGMVTPDDREGTFEEAERIGETLARMSSELLEEAPRLEVDRLTWWKKTLFIPNENLKYRIAIALDAVRRPLIEGHFQSEVSLIRLGPLFLVMVPGEASPSLAFQIDDLLSNRWLLFSLTNDELGYLMTGTQSELPLFAYEAGMSPSPRAGPIVLEALQELIALDRQRELARTF